MRILPALLIGALILGIAAFFFFTSSVQKKGGVVDLRGKDEVSIVLTDGGFEPERIRLTTGTRVTFSSTRDSQFWPASNLHPTHDIYSELDPGRPLNPDESWAFVFNKPGSWGMHDHIRSYFTATVYVED